MRRCSILVLCLVLVQPLVSAPATAELFSKSYVFKPGVTLEIGADAGNGLRLESVEFILPSSLGGGLFRSGGLAKVEIVIANKGNRARKVGIAIAVFDDDGRLLGVASGGSKLLAIKPDRQSYYRMTFENVNGEIFKATNFKITLEPKS
jgi:hypothetical protein